MSLGNGFAMLLGRCRDHPLHRQVEGIAVGVLGAFQPLDEQVDFFGKLVPAERQLAERHLGQHQDDLQARGVERIPLPVLARSSPNTALTRVDCGG
jgi:hypothetical protein